MAKKIIVSMTFRSFDGSDNDKIQRRFLQTVKNQSYKNFIMAVTIFGEKGVPEALKEFDLPHLLYHAPPGDYKKFSLTEVLLNGIRVSKEYREGCILLWTNADNILDPDYFERLANLEGEKIAGISYPHIGYRSLEDQKVKRGGKYGWYGLDTAFFSSDSFDDKFVKAVNDYPNHDYLYFEGFIVALATVFCKTLINLYPPGYFVIANNYIALKQTPENVKISGIKNMAELKRFIKDYNLPNKDWYYFILNYKVASKDIFKKWWMTILIYIRVTYACSYIRHSMPKIKRLLKLTK